MFADIAMRQALHAGKAVPASKSRCKPARKVARRNPFLFFGPFAP
jgi:hypothetical protein